MIEGAVGMINISHERVIRMEVREICEVEFDQIVLTIGIVCRDFRHIYVVMNLRVGRQERGE
jgi:hypothetical protein